MEVIEYGDAEPTPHHSAGVVFARPRLRGRRDRDYLVRNGSPYESDKPKIEDQLDKLEASVARNEGDIEASTRSLVRIETQVAQIRETLQDLDGKLDEITEALARTGSLARRE